MSDSINYHKYVATIEPWAAVRHLDVRSYCHWAGGSGSANVVVSSNTVTIDFVTVTDDQTNYTSEKYLYRRIYHYVNSALQAQRIFFSEQPLIQYPDQPELIEPQDHLPQLVQPSFAKPVTAHDLRQGLHIANIADLFPYLRWALRDYYLSFFFANYDAVVFIWRALASVLWNIGEGKGDRESDATIETVAGKLSQDPKEFKEVRKLSNHNRYQGRHGNRRAADRVEHFKGGTVERIFGSVIDESQIASMFPALASAENSPLVMDAIDLAPPSISNEELVEMRQFARNTLMKFIQYLEKTSHDNLISRRIPPVIWQQPL